MSLQKLKEEAFKLSPSDRLSLVSAIIDSLHKTSIAQSERSSAIQRMRGLLLKGNQPAPTDQEVKVILEQRRREKYIQ